MHLEFEKVLDCNIFKDCNNLWKKKTKKVNFLILLIMYRGPNFLQNYLNLRKIKLSFSNNGVIIIFFPNLHLIG